jgi:hypothetical protein
LKKKNSKTKQTLLELQERQDASQVLNNSPESFNGTTSNSLSFDCNPDERIAEKSAPFIGKIHPVFVLDRDGKPLTPTTYAKSQKLIRRKLATRVWSKFGFWGIELNTTIENPKTEATSLGYDPGSKFEGFSIVSGTENILNIKLDLPNKKIIVKKIEERKNLRNSRRHRKARCRPRRFQNRKRNEKIAPSQLVIINSRLKILRELLRICPITVVGLEDVRFNHAKYRWGKNFSTCEIGKSKIRKFLKEKEVKLFEFSGWETKELREKYGYKKISDKSANVFEAHNSDSLSLAIEVNNGFRLEPSKNLLLVNDKYRPVRRKLHYTQSAKGGKRQNYSKGNVFGINKGKVVGYKGNKYLLTGYQNNIHNGKKFTISELYNEKRKYVKTLDFISNSFNASFIQEVKSH